MSILKRIFEENPVFTIQLFILLNQSFFLIMIFIQIMSDRN